MCCVIWGQFSMALASRSCKQAKRCETKANGPSETPKTHISNLNGCLIAIFFDN